jgi:hypothetical protein
MYASLLLFSYHFRRCRSRRRRLANADIGSQALSVRALLGMLALSPALAEVGPLDAEMRSAFGYTLGQAVDDSAAELWPTFELDRFRVAADPYPLELDQIEIVLSARTRRVVLVSAAAVLADPQTCEQLAERLRNRMRQNLRLRFKQAKAAVGVWSAAKDSAVRQVQCADAQFKFELRDDALALVRSGESLARLETMTCDQASTPPVPRPDWYEERYAPLRTITTKDIEAPLARIASRTQQIYNRLLPRLKCLDQGRLAYTAVLDAQGRAVVLHLLSGSVESSGFADFVRAEIQREPFGVEAVDGKGYRLVSFALRYQTN